LVLTEGLAFKQSLKPRKIHRVCFFVFELWLLDWRRTDWHRQSTHQAGNWRPSHIISSCSRFCFGRSRTFFRMPSLYRELWGHLCVSEYGLCRPTCFKWPSAKFHIYRGRNVGIQPLKLSKFGILPTNLPPPVATRLHKFTTLSAFVGVCW